MYIYILHFLGVNWQPKMCICFSGVTFFFLILSIGQISKRFGLVNEIWRKPKVVAHIRYSGLILYKREGIGLAALHSGSTFALFCFFVHQLCD